MSEIKTAGIRNVTVTNWAKTFVCRPELYFEPRQEDELRKIVHLAKEENKKIRVVGCGHSPSDLPFSEDYAVNLKHFNNVLEVHKSQGLVKVQAGVILTDLIEKHLPQHGLALTISGSVSHVTVAGAISVATHGSGVKYGTLSSYVKALELMTSHGEIIECSRDSDKELFLAACCGLGAVGIILTVTLQCEPIFNLELNQYPLPLQHVLEHLTVHLQSSDYFRFTWFPYTDGVIMYHLKRTNKLLTQHNFIQHFLNWFWLYAVGYYACEFFYWISTFFPALVPWINRFFYRVVYSRPHTQVDCYYKLMKFECLFSQFVMEWSIPLEKTAIMLYELKEWLSQTPSVMAHFPVEVRFVKSEDVLLSPSNGRETCCINVVMYRPYGKKVSFEEYWKGFEVIAKRHSGRPHWAKMHDLGPEELRNIYPGYDTWCKMRHRMDPARIFCNAYLDRILD